MNVHKNARLTPLGRERIVRQVESGQTPEAVSETAGVCPRTVRKWVERVIVAKGWQGCKIAHPGRTISRQGNDHTLFLLQDPGGCGAVNIFTWGHPKLSNGDHVRVEGVFETVHHQDRSVFYNQVEATKVVVVPK